MCSLWEDFEVQMHPSRVSETQQCLRVCYALAARMQEMSCVVR